MYWLYTLPAIILIILCGGFASYFFITRICHTKSTVKKAFIASLLCLLLLSFLGIGSVILFFISEKDSSGPDVMSAIFTYWLSSLILLGGFSISFSFYLNTLHSQYQKATGLLFCTTISLITLWTIIPLPHFIISHPLNVTLLLCALIALIVLSTKMTRILKKENLSLTLFLNSLTALTTVNVATLFLRIL